MTISRLQTPCLVLDRAKLVRNIQTMNGRLKALGVPLRPHGKTAKCMEVMRLALADQSGSITASTLGEAVYFFGNGLRDILYAVGIAPNKLPRVAELVRDGANVTLILDSMEQAGFLAAFGEGMGVDFPVLIEIDSDGHRSGVQRGDPLLLELGRFLYERRGVALGGVMTHAGASYGADSVAEIRSIAATEREVAVGCAEQLRNAGLPCPIVSIGSTPTATMTGDLTGVTEVRAGVYLFNDLTMAGLGVCGLEDIALSVLATVIGHQKQRGWVIVDAGWMALSSDRATARQKIDQGYGVVCDVAGKPRERVIVSQTNQEHGIVSRAGDGEIGFEAFPIGRTVRILPNHACATAAMHDRYHVVEGGTEVIDIWHRINGW